MTAPTVQAETAVVGDLVEGVWGAIRGYLRAPVLHSEVRAAIRAAVSTGEQPGMSASDAERAWLEAEAQLSEISAAIGTVRFMDPPDGGSVTLAEQVRRMRAALDEAESLPDDLLSLSEAATQGEWVQERFNIKADTPVGKAPTRAMFHSKDDAKLAAASVNFIRTLAAKQGGKS